MPSSRHLLLTLLTKMPWGLSTPHLQTSSDSCRALEMVILTIQQKEKQEKTYVPEEVIFCLMQGTNNTI